MHTNNLVEIEDNKFHLGLSMLYKKGIYKRNEGMVLILNYFDKHRAGGDR